MPLEPQNNEKELFSQIAEGDESAFRELVQANVPIPQKGRVHYAHNKEICVYLEYEGQT